MPPNQGPDRALVDEDSDDEWDDPVGIGDGPVSASAPSTTHSTPSDAFARSIRCFRAAGALAGDFHQATPAADASPPSGVAPRDDGVRGEQGDGLGFLRDLARNLNQQAERELKRPRLE